MSDSKQKHHNPKPCSFCLQDVKYAPLKEMEYHGVVVYFCHTCNAEYLYYQNANLASSSLYTEINGKMYRWTVTASSGYLWYVKDPGEPGKRKNTGLVMIKSFDGDDIPYITPYNVNEKLRTYLLFL